LASRERAVSNIGKTGSLAGKQHPRKERLQTDKPLVGLERSKPFPLGPEAPRSVARRGDLDYHRGPAIDTWDRDDADARVGTPSRKDARVEPGGVAATFSEGRRVHLSAWHPRFGPNHRT